MSIEKEKKPRKAPAKKTVAPEDAEKKAKAAAKPTASSAPKSAAPKAKAAAKSAAAAGVPESAAAMTNMAGRPTHEQIAERAYSLFIERGWRHGHHEQDWFRAEQELLTRR